MARPGLVLRTQELGGKILAIGGDHARGITFEAPVLQSDVWGPSTAQMILKRDPNRQWPDLRASAPVQILDRGVPVWLGRIKQTPMTSGGIARQISLVCEGQQFRLDDDVYERFYVITDLSGFKDARQNPNAVLGASSYFAAGVASADGNGIYLGYAKDQALGGGERVGVILDTGPGQAIKAISIDWQSSNNYGSSYLYARASDGTNFGPSEATLGTLEDMPGSGFVNNTGASGTLSGALTGSRRYFALLHYSAIATTIGADVFFRITGIRLFGDDAYRSGSASILKASDIVRDALTRAVIGVDDDYTLVASTSFSIPEFAMSGPATPRDVITAANAYHKYQFRVRADNRPEFRAFPAKPTIMVGADAVFDEASAGDAGEIYTDVVVRYTDAAGNAGSLAARQPASLPSIAPVQPTNPSFDVDTSGWPAIGGLGTPSRDTTVFDSSPASLKLAITLEGLVRSTSWTSGAFVAGRSYQLSGRWRVDNAALIPTIFIRDADGLAASPATSAALTVNTFTSFIHTFQLRTTGTPEINFQATPEFAANMWLDSLVLSEILPTLIDRWGYRRTKVLDTNMTLTPAAAQQIADVFLAAHRTTPLKGKLTVSGDGVARRSPNGAPMHASELLGCTGDLVRMTNLIDPETGKVGRIGRIANASWDADSNTCTLDIDSTSTNFEAMLARLAVVTGQVRR